VIFQKVLNPQIFPDFFASSASFAVKIALIGLALALGVLVFGLANC